MKFNDINTERFVLKVLTPELVGEEYLSWFSEEDSLRYIDYAKKKISISDLKEYVVEKLLSSNALLLGVFTNDNIDHIGNIKFEPLDFENGNAVLGVLIGSKKWRGLGVFGEINQAIEKELKNLGIRKIYLGVSKDNVAAVNAYYKSGYILDVENFLGVDDKNSICMVKVI